MPIPDVPGRRVFNAFLTGTGELRVANSFWGRSTSRSPRPLNGVRAAMRDYSEICIWMLFVMIVISGAIGFRTQPAGAAPVRLGIRETANQSVPTT